jgi:hypothetical protein
MSNVATAPKRPLFSVALFAVVLLLLATGAYFGLVALETYVLAERIHLLTSAKKLQVGMTQEAVENLFGVEPEDRKAPDPGFAGTFPPKPHDGVKRYSEDSDRNGTYVNYSGWYRGVLVTSQHHIQVTYDRDGKVKEWKRL